jgi:energy-coupling factor transporter ATP-binding protein EcfA2
LADDALLVEDAARAPATAGLSIDGLTVRYFGRDVDALQDVSLEVPPGSLVAVAGANGAGKSTLALAAAGFIPRIVRAQLSGQIRVGASIDKDGAEGRLHEVGIVFANPHNQLSATKATVREELAFGLENLGIPRSEMDPRIDDVLERLRIGHLADRSPFALSGGEQQRVAIASIVAMGMRVLVLDEPTAQLDPLSTSAVGDLLGSLAAEGSSVLVAEHAPTILGAAGQCLLLAEGRPITVDVPGRALSSNVLAPIGLHAPTLVLLAEAAGLGPESAFDEEAIARALGRGMPVAASLPDSPSPVAWTAVRDVQPAAISIHGLRHVYPGGVEAIRGVDLDIAPGESVAIIGQNGSGKTTLVKHLNGLLRPDAGNVAIDGRDIGREPIHELAATVGFVFQNPDDQLFNRTVEREIRFGPHNLRLTTEETGSLVDAALAAIGLDADRMANPYDLNVSSRKLVALGSILATDPSILVLDEPTTGQDGPGVARVGWIVDSLAAADRTVVAITHDMEFAARHFRRVVVMRMGEVVADGPPSDIFQPANVELLASTGLTPPPAARIAARLGMSVVPADAAELVEAMRVRAERS